MKESGLQPSLSSASPAEEWDKDAARRSLDELFNLARKYNSTKAYFELMQFISRFHYYAPYNALLVHVQMPGATFVAPPRRWKYDYGRRLKPGARPLVILQPMGPVMFVFDVGDTEPEEDAPPLPREVEFPFEVRHGYVDNELTDTIENAKRDGVRVTEHNPGSGSAGSIRIAGPGKHLDVLIKTRPEREYIPVPLRYDLLLNATHSPEARYATLAHELGHLYCGHLGTPNATWWPDRHGISREAQEFEAESVSYLLCKRLDIDTPSESYLSIYVDQNIELPAISLEYVVKAAGLIEQMGRERPKPRKAANK